MKTCALIVRRLKSETSAEIGICSLFSIGEAPESVDPMQRELNRRVAEYGESSGKPREEGVNYIPAYEAMHAQIVASPGPHSPRSDFFRSIAMRGAGSCSVGRSMRLPS